MTAFATNSNMENIIADFKNILKTLKPLQIIFLFYKFMIFLLFKAIGKL